MAEQTTWIIGASKECDIVIDEDTISGTHCQLNRDDTIYSIEDLNSTNGVYVNGEQVFEVTFVTEQDSITLGKNVPFNLPAIPENSTESVEESSHVEEEIKEITIGRSKNNDIVIEDSQISNNHAILKCDSNQLILLDLNSSNGTFLGEAKKAITESIVLKEDIVYFSSNRFLVSDLLLQAGIEFPEVQEDVPEEIDAFDSQVDYRPYLKLIMACIIALVIVVSLPFILPSEPEDQGGNLPNPVSQADTPRKSDIEEYNQLPNNQDVEGDNEVPVDQPDVMIKEDAIFALIVGNADQTEYYQAGTAFAVGPNTLLTAGTCKKRIDLVKKKYPLVFILQKQLIPIASIELHPQYALAIQEETLMQKKLAEAASQVESSPEPQLAEDQLEAAYKNFLLATQESHHYDVAIINSPQKLSSWLTLDQLESPLLPQSRITLFGSSFDSQAPFISPDSGVSLEEQKTRVQKLVSLNQSSMSPVLVTGKVDPGNASIHLETDWTGVPILNKKNRVIAIYSRITPSNTIFSPPTGENYDAALVHPLLPFIRDKSEIK